MAARIATAPISWGVSEVADWGYQLPPERVLAEMCELGFTATELGAQGFLPPAPADKAARLAEFGLQGIGSFVPVVVHDPDIDPLPRIEQELADYAAAGADVLVVSTVTGIRGYDQLRPELDAAGWSLFMRNLDRISQLAVEHGVLATLHPHVGTMIETNADIMHVIDGSSMQICFDTGHMMIGGTDPVAFAEQYAERIAYSHLKDVSVAAMERVKRGEISYFDSIVADELYTPLGRGDVDIKSIVSSMLKAGFDGWFVLEQDKVLHSEPAPGTGPIEDARASVEWLRGTLAELGEQGVGA